MLGVRDEGHEALEDEFFLVVVPQSVKQLNYIIACALQGAVLAQNFVDVVLSIFGHFF
jgi:hypothetical protein